jgi:peptide/nickel transport system substrate-binding protein
MNKRIVGSIALAAAGIVTVAACSSSHSSSTGTSTGNSSGSAITMAGAIGQIPASSGSQNAGTITWGMTAGAVPDSIFPIVNSSDNSVFNTQSFQYEFWRPLYWYVDGTEAKIDPTESLANPPTYSNGDKTVTITLKGTYKWSNGNPVTSDDIAFDIDLIKAALKESPANWASYVPGNFPDDLASMSEPNSNTLVLNLTGAVNPGWFYEDLLAAGPITPLPSLAWAKTSVGGSIIPASQWNAGGTAGLKVDEQIYNFLGGPTGSQNTDVKTYGTNPLWQVVDGPYKISAFNASNGGFTMVPNDTYAGPHAPHMSTIVAETFTSTAAQFNALKAGSLDVGNVDNQDAPQLQSLTRTGYAYFGMPDFGDNTSNFNFKDQTGHFGAIASQLYFREAMAHLQDQEGWINAFMFKSGDQAFGPLPQYPTSPYDPSNAKINPYPYSVSDAVALLKSHGWTINPQGTDVCSDAGTGANQCGAGIPAGTKLAFGFIYDTSSPQLVEQQAQNLAESAKQAGIEITLSGQTFNALLQKFFDPSGPADYNTWAMNDIGGETDVPYPTTFGEYNTGGPSNVGDYSDPTMDNLIHQSVYGSNASAVENEASFLATNVPALFQPNPDYIWAWKTSVGSTEPSALESLTQYFLQPEFWYLTTKS